MSFPYQQPSTPEPVEPAPSPRGATAGLRIAVLIGAIACVLSLLVAVTGGMSYARARSADADVMSRTERANSERIEVEKELSDINSQQSALQTQIDQKELETVTARAQEWCDSVTADSLKGDIDALTSLSASVHSTSSSPGEPVEETVCPEKYWAVRTAITFSLLGMKDGSTTDCTGDGSTIHVAGAFTYTTPAVLPSEMAAKSADVLVQVEIHGAGSEVLSSQVVTIPAPASGSQATFETTFPYSSNATQCVFRGIGWWPSGY